MEYHFNYLELLPQILEKQKKIEELLDNHIEKRWLTTKELTDYLGYSKDAINKKVQDGEFVTGIHYHKTAGKRLFDKFEIDNWVIGINSSKTSSSQLINELVEDITIKN